LYWIEGDATDIRYQVLVNCDLQMVGEEFSRKPYAVAVHEGSPLRDLLNDAILRLLNQRRLETLKERWWTENPDKKDCGDMNDQSDGISIQNIGSFSWLYTIQIKCSVDWILLAFVHLLAYLGGVFIVIFVGIILACITLFIEFIYFKFNKNAKRSVTNVLPANETNRNRQPYIMDANRAKGEGVDQYGNNDYGFYGKKDGDQK